MQLRGSPPSPITGEWWYTTEATMLGEWLRLSTVVRYLGLHGILEDTLQSC